MDTFEKMAMNIVDQQELIIGPLALEEAARVPGITVQKESHVIVLGGDKKTLLDQLVARYERLFGKASLQVCRDASRDLIQSIPEAQRPSFLQS